MKTLLNILITIFESDKTNYFINNTMGHLFHPEQIYINTAGQSLSAPLIQAFPVFPCLRSAAHNYSQTILINSNYNPHETN